MADIPDPLEAAAEVTRDTAFTRRVAMTTAIYAVVLEKEAKRLEHERDRNKARDPNFDFAEALLQIAIVIASVSILSTSRFLYAVSLVFAAVSVLLRGNGYLPLIPLPF